MLRKHGSTLSGLVALLFLILLATPVRAAWNQAYCSTQNTGNTDVYVQQYMSNGNCTDHCRELSGAYAFAVIQYQDCYCSNLIPRSQVDVNRCQKQCPGFGTENCGNIDDGLFIYIQNGQPSGTAPGPSSAQPTSKTVSSSVPQSSPPPPPTSTQATSSSSSPQPTSTKPAPTPTPTPPPQSSQAPTSPEEPQKSIEVTTVSGAIITRIVTLSPSSNPSSSSAPVRTDDNDKGPNIGAIAGGVAGGVIALFVILGGIFFFLWRRRKQQQQAQEGDNSGSSGGITRNTSTMSKAGLLGGHQFPSRQGTNLSTQNSRYGADQESISPSSNRRNSQPLVIDSRLNPNAVMTFAGASLSRESVASLDDSRDYGRQLNVRNPDP